ncbi:MAG: PLP-dependent aminotransferase family protein [Peptostreptococcaceae bacterium]|nr:PLP-dependent aminotransferase family protein [Peptostreptococcaceae bacterium]
MREILPTLDRSSKEPMYSQLYKYIKTEIENGSIREGEKLPSIRNLSKKMGISITTIRLAYDQLAMEGYILNKEKSGYYVNKLDFVEEVMSLSYDSAHDASKVHFERMVSIYDEECFDFIKWKKCLNHVLVYQSKFLLADADFQGEMELREQIAKYVFQSRGVHCNSDEVVVGAGTQQLMNILTAILNRAGRKSIGFEDPGYVLSRNIFGAQHFKIHNLPIDEEGILLADAFAKKLDLLYVSPSHQFPTGIVMSAARRSQLLSWARDTRGYIIEDDYDSELRYFGRPIPALKAMDKSGRVIYMGSFSSTLLPSIRISYLVLPKELLAIYQEIKNSYSQGVSKVDQLALCKFMEDGYYQRHIRRIRRLYSEKASMLSDFLNESYRGKVRIISNTSGLFMIIELRCKYSEEEIADEFVRHGMKATPFGSYVQSDYAQKKPNLLLYFYNVESAQLPKIIEQVCDKIFA